ncbi:virulence RhuM family protein [Methanobrevibacter sp.]|uniref:virulence RhuM family protein n=1 Tax=Methanobrevibacter sp. TaxID=66852 RepID=UPI0025E8375D|nr:virulence RhuM family protein [Methanobrevibacter sp.]MBQ2665289.1 virulence RhuM family protein [Methanobrevibacter sp.]
MKENQIIRTLLYVGNEGEVSMDVIIDHEQETMWATQKTMAELFDVKEHTINYHLKNIFRDGELNENSVTRKIRVTASDGKKYNTGFYNLDAIISVGYRVNSKNATHFRIWATGVLKEFIVKGFVLDDELLKNGSRFGKDYFQDLLERIREIRVSERRFYEKLTDLYATSHDYNKNAEITQEFYAKVQNKLHYAISGMTAPEIIKNRASSEKENMGLTSWKHSPKGKIQLSDTKIAKNYLSEEELAELNKLVELYLNFAELQATRRIPMAMKDWAEELDKFLDFVGYQILEGKGKVSRSEINEFVEVEFDKFRPIQDKLYKSDYNEFEERTRKLINK